MILIRSDVVLTMPICRNADWHIKVQPFIIHNRWYSQVYRCDKLILSALIIAAATACERRSLYDDCPGDVSIPVKVDWSVSGITPNSGSDDDVVHRVSLRFFPKDGSATFDRYLEGNVSEGEIKIPVGVYSVVVYNEAIDDVYWNEAIWFDKANDYNLFSANIVEISPISYDFYTPQPGEKFAPGLFKLASWSLDHFEVTQTPENCTDCGGVTNDALTKIKLRRLTIPTHVVADVANLKSAMRMEAAFTGLARKVYMASGNNEMLPTTHLFAFQSPVWNDDTHTDGWVERRLLTFGRLPQSSLYSLNLGVILVSGERYMPSTPLYYDIKNQIESSLPQGDIEVRVNLTLPEKVDGDINVGGWDDEEHIIQ